MITYIARRTGVTTRGLGDCGLIALASLLLFGCSHRPPAANGAGPERAAQADALADCPRPVDTNAEFLAGGLARGEPDPCLPALNECVRACRESICGKAMIGGGCAHLCSGIEPYLARAKRFREGQFDEQCRSLVQ